MKLNYFFLSILACIFLSSCKQQKQDSITTLYFIRHAEKDRSDIKNKNPHLTETGKARAKHWAEILKHVKFDAVYSTDYNRTIETGLPTAKQNNLTIQLYDANKLDADKIRNNHTGNNVLIIGHSDTTPKFVNKFLEAETYPAINDSNNGNLYILTIANKTIKDLLLVMNAR